MSSLAIKSTVPNINKTSVLKDLAQNFINQSLRHINENQEIIRKVNVVIQQSPFQKEKVENGHKHNCYTKLEGEMEHCWNKPTEDFPVPEAWEGELTPEDLSQLRSQWPSIVESHRQEFDQLKAEYSQFLIQQKQVVKADISDDLEGAWVALAERVEEHRQHGPLAFVEGKIKLQITTVDRANERLESTRNFKMKFNIADQRLVSIQV